MKTGYLDRNDIIIVWKRITLAPEMLANTS